MKPDGTRPCWNSDAEKRILVDPAGEPLSENPFLGRTGRRWLTCRLRICFAVFGVTGYFLPRRGCQSAPIKVCARVSGRSHKETAPQRHETSRNERPNHLRLRTKRNRPPSKVLCSTAYAVTAHHPIIDSSNAMPAKTPRSVPSRRGRRRVSASRFFGGLTLNNVTSASCEASYSPSSGITAGGPNKPPMRSAASGFRTSVEVRTQPADLLTQHSNGLSVKCL